MSVRPGQLDLQCEQGDDFALTLSFKNAAGAAINYTGHTFAAVVVTAAGNISFAVNTTSIATGVIVITLTDTQTALLPVSSTWRIKKTDTLGNLDTMVKGTFTTGDQ